MKDSQFFKLKFSIEFQMTKQVYKYYRKTTLIDMKNMIDLKSKFRLFSNDNLQAQFCKKLQSSRSYGLIKYKAFKIMFLYFYSKIF